MQKILEFHFDFASPYSYFAQYRVPEIAARFGLRLMHLPLDLRVAKLAAGNTAPPTRAIPTKLAYSRIDQQRWAAHYGVPIARPKSYESTRLNIGTFFADDRGQTQDYVSFVWRKIWGEGGDMVEEALFAETARRLGWDAAEFIAFTDSPEGQERFRQSTAHATERGIFGVPMIAIGDEMWWGNDRLDFVTRFLEAEATGVAGKQAAG
jgi:2-hydroxychromene-2-carboxylate isomerase